jgi:ribosomal protein S16
MFHNVIRLRRRPYKRAKEFDIIVISTKCKVTSMKVVEKLGYIRLRKPRVVSVNFHRMGYYLNDGVKLHDSVKRYLIFFCR